MDSRILRKPDGVHFSGDWRFPSQIANRAPHDVHGSAAAGSSRLPQVTSVFDRLNGVLGETANTVVLDRHRKWQGRLESTSPPICFRGKLPHDI